MISISSRLALALFIANTITPLFPSTQARVLRKSKKQEECTILVRTDLRFDNVDDPSFECILDPNDTEADGLEMLVDGTGMISTSAYSVLIDVTEEQKKELRNKLASGELVSNVSTLKMDNFDISDEAVRIPRNQKNLEFGTPRKGTNNNQNPIHRHLANVTGVKPILVVKVKDSEGRVRSETPSEISNDIFGSFGDSMTLKSQMHDCSFGQLDIVPGVVPNDSGVNENSPGVIEVQIDVSLSNRRSKVRNAVRRAVENKYGIILPGPYQHVMFVLEGCYEDCGWAAYAYMNSWLSVYQGNYYKFVGVQMHELGHNFNLLHSGGLDGRTYTDHTGMMGNALYQDDIGAMCWNPAKSWQIGWYGSNRKTIDPRQGSGTWSGTIVGIANYDTNPEDYPVIIKIETGTGADQFIGFNRAMGVNRHNDEADDEVTIVETSGGGGGESAAQSYLKAHLVQGEEYVYPNWDDSGMNLIIKANKIHIDNSTAASATAVGYGYAEVQVCLGECTAVWVTPSPTPMPTSAPSPSPTPYPTPLPTSAPTHSCQDSNERFQIIKPDGRKKRKSCEWVNRVWTTWKCQNVIGAKENCPLTCTNCCQDSKEIFLVNGKNKNCEWAKVKDTAERCEKAPTSLKCPLTCGEPACMN